MTTEHTAIPEELRILADLAALPAAPFHEERVFRYVRERLAALPVDVKVDGFGNAIAHYRRGGAQQSLALVAHLDHPALEIVAAPAGPRGLLLGGVAAECFGQPVPVRLFRGDVEYAGEVTGYERDASTRELWLDVRGDRAIAAGDWGVFALEDFRLAGDRIYMRAADDLTGVNAILQTLAQLAREDRPGDVYGVFTRAEEVGLLGAVLVAKQRLLPADTIVVSLESSRALPGAELGGGPVIRVGDIRRSFDPAGEAILLAARARLGGSIPVQRQLMSGGTCEATAFAAYGYLTTGVAVPLGNYHNVGPERIISSEYVDRRDVTGEVALLVEAVAVAAAGERADVYPGLDARAEAAGERLRASYSSWAAR